MRFVVRLPDSVHGDLPAEIWPSRLRSSSYACLFGERYNCG